MSPRAPRAAVCLPQHPNDSAGGGDDGNDARWQQDHLELLLAEQLVDDEHTRGSNPGRAVDKSAHATVGAMIHLVAGTYSCKKRNGEMARSAGLHI